MGNFQVKYDSRVVNYNRRDFIRLAPEINHDDWMFQVPWIFLTNQIALFSIATLAWYKAIWLDIGQFLNTKSAAFQHFSIPSTSILFMTSALARAEYLCAQSSTARPGPARAAPPFTSNSSSKYVELRLRLWLWLPLPLPPLFTSTWAREVIISTASTHTPALDCQKFRNGVGGVSFSVQMYQQSLLLKSYLGRFRIFAQVKS